ncbi:protein SOSEKI 3-like isoform X1 [Zingiber officinale]|uniref:protein SOSEKI 3-like isoform X1 n=1 Tax=Zingiber officinale TaxID=94328 RepID=UPI001C4C8702|nr:protein SOSEKI 3-like isoform X1 [Zingiber officinale]
MEARTRRYAPQAGPERTKVWTEPPPKFSSQQQHGSKVPVVYYLCRNRHLEHPHFMEVPLSSSDGLYLKDVIDRLNLLRGRKMATMYSWSCKRSYKNGFVWHDLSEDDLIFPVQGNEYVLKGSELLDQTPPDRNSEGVSNTKIQNPRRALQDPPPICRKVQEASGSLSPTTVVVIKEAKMAPPPVQPSPVQGDDQSLPTRRSVSSPGYDTRSAPSSPAEYRICKPIKPEDGSTETDDDRGGRTCESNVRVVGVSTDDKPRCTDSDESRSEHSVCLKEEPEIVKVERSPPPTYSSASSSCGKMNTLECLMRDEASKRFNCEIVEEEVFFPTETKLKATNMLMHLITCGSISVKDHYSFGFVPSYKPKLVNVNLTPPMFANSMIPGKIDCLSESQREISLGFKKKEHTRKRSIKTNKNKETTGEGAPNGNQSPSFDENRSCNMAYFRGDEEKVVDSTQSNCLPRTQIIPSGKHSRNDIINTSTGPEICKSSPCSSSNGGSRRILDSSSIKGSSSRRLESFREEQEKMITIEERLTSGARVIIQSSSCCDDTEDISD